jgi:hypothetical protein
MHVYQQQVNAGWASQMSVAFCRQDGRMSMSQKSFPAGAVRWPDVLRKPPVPN